MRKNIDIVAPGNESSWTFHIAGEAKKVSEVLDEITTITAKIMDISKEIFLPTDIHYLLVTLPTDIPANNILETLGFKFVPTDRVEETIKSENGISSKEFKEKIYDAKIRTDTVKSIRRISLNGKTNFVLQEGVKSVSRSSPINLYAHFDNDKMIYEELRPDPFWINISHCHLEGENKWINKDSPAHYCIDFWTETDIWFEKTYIGRANRDRFRSMIRKIIENFNVTGTFFKSDWFSREDLKEVAFGKD